MQLSYLLLIYFNSYSLQSSGNAKSRARDYDYDHDRACDRKFQPGQKLLISYIKVNLILQRSWSNFSKISELRSQIKRDKYL